MATTGLMEIAARLEAFRRSADPDCLWPDVPRAARLEGHRRIVSATRVALRGDPAGLLAEDEASARAIGIAAFESGMGPLLGWWVDRGMLHTSAPLTRALATHLAHGSARAAKLRAIACTVLSRLNQRAIRPVLLKGTHTADAYFPDPGTRAGADMDLLVEPGQLERACSALHACGLTESRRTERPFHSEWTPIGPTPMVQSLEFNHADNPWTVDLHISLDKPYLGKLRATLGAPTADHTAPYDYHGHSAAVLRQPLLATYLAIHAAWEIHEIQLVRLVELALVLRRDSAQARFDPEALNALLRQTGTGRFAYPALALVEHLLPGTVSREVLDTVESSASGAARRVVAAMVSSGSYRLPRRSVQEKLMWAKGLRECLGVMADAALGLSESLSAGERLALLRRRASMVLGRRAGLLARSASRPEDSDQPARRHQTEGPGPQE